MIISKNYKKEKKKLLKALELYIKKQRKVL